MREISERKGAATGWQIGGAALILLAVIGGIVAAMQIDGLDPKAMADWIRAQGAWGEVALVALMVLHSFVPFPAEILALAAGAVYGTLWGTFLIWTGAMIGACLSFALARWLGQPFVRAVLTPRSRASLDEWTRDRGATSLLISRFIPVIAFNLINYAAGLTRVSWWTFLWTTAIGILPLTTLMVAMGASMVDLSWPELSGISAVCIGLAVAGHWLARRRGWI